VPDLDRFKTFWPDYSRVAGFSMLVFRYLRLSMPSSSNRPADVRLWHKADILVATSNVRFRG
jgi:hypothetical protein